MRLRTSTLAVSAAALLTTTGVAVAFVDATVLTGSGTVQTRTESLQLEVTVDPVVEDVIGRGTVQFDVIGANPSTSSIPLALGQGRLEAPQLRVFERPGTTADCPEGSFVVGAPTGYTGVQIRPGGTAVVARIPVSFVNLPVAQDACIGATLRFSWPAPRG